jgi:ABC-2 type transport system permease protein
MYSKMRKYLTVFTISLQEFFTYRLNFVMWRVRQVFVFLIPYFIWRSVLSGGGEIYGYDFAAIMTYLFGTTILRSLVMGSRSIDLGWMINSGYLSIPLLKPLSVFRFFFVRDLADKLYNLSFIFLEIPLIILIFHPPVFVQTDLVPLISSLLSIALAILIYFFINILFGSIAFWSRDIWAPRFLLWVIMEFATGAMFPLDMLSSKFQSILYLTPFPYLLFVPLKLYLGQLQPVAGHLLVQIIWVTVLYLLARHVWQKGLRVYEAEGR